MKITASHWPHFMTTPTFTFFASNTKSHQHITWHYNVPHPPLTSQLSPHTCHFTRRVASCPECRSTIGLTTSGGIPLEFKVHVATIGGSWIHHDTVTEVDEPIGRVRQRVAELSWTTQYHLFQHGVNFLLVYLAIQLTQRKLMGNAGIWCLFTHEFFPISLALAKPFTHPTATDSHERARSPRPLVRVLVGEEIHYWSSYVELGEWPSTPATISFALRLHWNQNWHGAIDLICSTSLRIFTGCAGSLLYAGFFDNEPAKPRWSSCRCLSNPGNGYYIRPQRGLSRCQYKQRRVQASLSRCQLYWISMSNQRYVIEQWVW